MSLKYPAIRPGIPAGKHLSDIQSDSRILNFSKSRISDIQLSGRISIQYFPTSCGSLGDLLRVCQLTLVISCEIL